MAIHIDYDKLEIASQKAKEAAAHAKKMREEAEKATERAEAAEAEEARLGEVMQAILRGEDVDIETPEAFLVCATIDDLRASYTDDAEEEESPVDESPSNGNGAEAIAVQPEIVVEEMTDEDAEFLPCGNELPRPELPLKHHEVAHIHKPYLNQVDGPYITRALLERFEVSRAKSTTGTITHTYVCVVCEGHFDSYDCDTFAGLPLCKRDSGLVKRYLSDSGYKTSRLKEGEVVEGSPFSMHLGFAFKVADQRRRTDESADDAMTERTLAWEAVELERLRSDDDDESDVPTARVHGMVALDAHTLARFSEDDGLGADALDLAVSDGMSTRRRSGGITAEVADDVEVTIPPVTQEELDAATREIHYITLMGPFSRLKRDIERRYREDDTQPENAHKQDPAWRFVVGELARIHMSWEEKDPTGHQFFKDKGELRRLFDERDQWLAQEKAKKEADDGYEHRPFPQQDRISELQAKDGVLDAVTEWIARSEKRGSGDSFETKKSKGAPKKKRSTPPKAKKGEVRTGQRKKFKKGSKQK